MERLIEYAKETIKKHPELLHEINDLIQLCKDEIEQGESPEHEIQLCIEDIRQLIENNDD